MEALHAFFAAHPTAWLLLIAIVAALVLRALVRLACLGMTIVVAIALIIIDADVLG